MLLRISHVIALAGFLCSSVYTLRLWIYALENDSGNTGWPILLGTVVLQGLAVGAGSCSAYFDTRRLGKVSFSSASCLSAGSVGFLYGVFLHYTAILREFHDWIRSGQPDQPEFKDSLATLGFLIALCVGLALFRITTSRSRAEVNSQ